MGNSCAWGRIDWYGLRYLHGTFTCRCRATLMETTWKVVVGGRGSVFLRRLQVVCWDVEALCREVHDHSGFAPVC